MNRNIGLYSLFCHGFKTRIGKVSYNIFYVSVMLDIGLLSNLSNLQFKEGSDSQAIFHIRKFQGAFNHTSNKPHFFPFLHTLKSKALSFYKLHLVGTNFSSNLLNWFGWFILFGSSKQNN